ncbi:MAG: DUF4280 domain-containing protein [Myxococcota bacterium]
MATLVGAKAAMRCSEGSAPSNLALSERNLENQDTLATVDDHQPTINIPPFGLCKSMANPSVAAATSAAQGVLTPQPCVPHTTTPWSPGAQFVRLRVGGKAVTALTNGSTCNCA